MQTPFNTGDTYYLPRTTGQQITVECPTCAGKKTVELILGSGEVVTVPCEGCGLGYEGPRGVVSDYTYEPHAEMFIISRVDSMHLRDGVPAWYVLSTTGIHANFSDLFKTHESAMVASAIALKIVQEERMRSSGNHTRHMYKKHTWTVAYHEKCIRDLEKQIAYHRSKVSERKVRAPLC